MERAFGTKKYSGQCNEEQFELIKLFLDSFKVKSSKLAKAWNIDIRLVRTVEFSPNFQMFVEYATELPMEDILGGLV